ncbi:thioredoxin [Pseudorhodobacter sp. E13]|uniref:thioredoxin family protein n=1 Tax=Pseudorhodobacter sp. E13 TaxID=2487931 RepID=UPI000F8CAF53|nr:thioredoxin family protein [Pseudorhodobacter sp. E13]RUS59781.1 thioredoxin [Pseudorhodobacter sp. E13]
MNRRDFMLLTAAVTLAAPMARAEAAAYTPDLLEAELAAGKTVFLDFKASWCSTCKAQGRVIAALKAENPEYAAKISFIDVDWDQWKDDMIVADLNIPRRSTLVVLRGDAELGRIVAGTAKDEIKALLDTALAGA